MCYEVWSRTQHFETHDPQDQDSQSAAHPTSMALSENEFPNLKAD